MILHRILALDVTSYALNRSNKKAFVYMFAVQMYLEIFLMHMIHNTLKQRGMTGGSNRAFLHPNIRR